MIAGLNREVARVASGLKAERADGMAPVRFRAEPFAFYERERAPRTGACLIHQRYLATIYKPPPASLS